jgi:hypothetical protein
MRTKRSQCDCQEAKRSCDSKKQNGHIVTSGELAGYPTPFSNRSGLIAGFGESF